MPVRNYKLLFEQDAKAVITLEGFAISILSLIEAAEEMAENSPYSYRTKLDALYAIKHACEEVIEEQIILTPDFSVGGEQGEGRRHVSA